MVDVSGDEATASHGRLLAIARRPARRAPMEVIVEGMVTVERGLDGDHKGAKFPRRQITVLAIEDWRAALGALASASLFPDLVPDVAWTVRRANLLVEGIELPKAKGGILAIGDVVLEVTAETSPCRRMEEAQSGLLKALSPDWRGGVTCRVVSAGRIATGDLVMVTNRPARHRRHLPG